MKKTTEFQNESDASAAWEARLRQLGPARPTPDKMGTARVEFCAGFMAAAKARR